MVFTIALTQKSHAPANQWPVRDNTVTNSLRAAVSPPRSRLAMRVHAGTVQLAVGTSCVTLMVLLTPAEVRVNEVCLRLPVKLAITLR